MNDQIGFIVKINTRTKLLNISVVYEDCFSTTENLRKWCNTPSKVRLLFNKLKNKNIDYVGREEKLCTWNSLPTNFEAIDMSTFLTSMDTYYDYFISLWDGQNWREYISSDNFFGEPISKFYEEFHKLVK